MEFFSLPRCGLQKKTFGCEISVSPSEMAPVDMGISAFFSESLEAFLLRTSQAALACHLHPILRKALDNEIFDAWVPTVVTRTYHPL